MRRCGRSALKILVALAVVVAVGLLLGGVGGLPLPRAVATIFDLHSARAPLDAQATFARTLRQLNHDEPQRFSLNGNTIFFSVRHVQQTTPQRLLEEYQEAFMLAGLNDRQFLSVDPAEAHARFFTGIRGGVVPHSITDRHITMGGVLVRNEPGTDQELFREVFRGGDESDLLRGHRWVEIFKEDQSPWTTVIASWSDGATFDYREMVPELRRRSSQHVDALLPRCPRCILVHDFQDTGRPDSGHLTAVLSSDLSIDQLRDFYHRVLPAEGWEIDEKGELLEKLRRQSAHTELEATFATGRRLAFRRGGQELRLEVLELAGGERAVHATFLGQRHDEEAAAPGGGGQR